MTAQAALDLALRPLLPTDVPLLAQIYRASIEELTADDYSQEQQEAWASAADDEDAFGKRLADRLTIVATLDGTPIGFATLADGREIDMLFVHPEVAGRGAGTMLCDALEKLAKARGATRVTTDASDTALSFFERRNYVAQQRNAVLFGGQWMAHTTMHKQLTGEGPK